MVITQRQVAVRAGVSPRTVSNVVNGAAYVAEETRQRVQQVLDELDYRPNVLARSLRQGRTRMLALVLPLNVPYFSELTAHVVDAAAAHDYTVIIDKTDGQAQREREFLVRSARAALYDGIVFSPSGLDETELGELAGAMPVVLLGRRGVKGYDHVVIDNIAAARAATHHLIDTGRRRIAVIGRHPHSAGDIAFDRTEGYRQALRDAGRRPDDRLVVSTEGFDRDAGLMAMERLLESTAPPDAVFCYNDPLALGATRAALRRGMRVPDDVAVVGFDDSEDGRFSTPTLTTVAQDKAAIAGHAVDLLLRRLDGKRHRPTTRVADWHLETRESTLGTAWAVGTRRPDTTRGDT